MKLREAYSAKPDMKNVAAGFKRLKNASLDFSHGLPEGDVEEAKRSIRFYIAELLDIADDLGETKARNYLKMAYDVLITKGE